MPSTLPALFLGQRKDSADNRNLGKSEFCHHTLPEVLLEFKNVTKSFTGTLALNDVSFQVRSRQVLALLGENGAGKSTLMKILSGVWPAGTYQGQLLLRNVGSGILESTKFSNTRDAARSGVVMIHQELSVFPELTVGEHLEISNLPIWIRWSALHGRVQKFLDNLNLPLRSQARVGELSIAGRQLVEIAKAIYQDARILVFDEPTSALTSEEVNCLYKIIERLKGDGKAIIYITHRMDEVFHLADRVAVLRDGLLVIETNLKQPTNLIAGLTSNTIRSEIEVQLIQWMVGRKIEDIYPKRSFDFNQGKNAEIMRVKNLTLVSPQKKVLLRQVSFSLARGEIIGLAGLMGAGRSETLEALFGVLNHNGTRAKGFRWTGDVWIHGKKIDLKTPREAIRHRIALVTEDRKGSGLILNQSILKNMLLPALASGKVKYFRQGIFKLFKWIKIEQELHSAQQKIKEFRIKLSDLTQNVGELSGGNQQKVVLSKWLLTEPEILFLDEPTRGIDIGAKVEIYHWVHQLARAGTSIIIASSEMPELLGMCDNILVLKRGEIKAHYRADQTNQEEILRAAAL